MSVAEASLPACRCEGGPLSAMVELPHDLGKGALLIEIEKGGVLESEGRNGFPGGVEQGGIEGGDGAMTALPIPWVAQVAVAELEPPAQVSDQDEGPLFAPGVVTLG